MRNRNLGVTVVLAVASLVGACGGDEDTTAAGAATTTTTAVTGGAGGSGADGGSGSAGGGGEAGSGGVVPNDAPLSVAAVQFDIASGPSWQAHFLSYFTSDPDRRCNRQVIDNCTIIDCRSSVYGTEPPTWVSVGAVTYSDGISADVVIEPDIHNAYDPENGPTEKWPPGSVVSISATGGDLPGFETSVTVPAALDVLVPDLENIGDGEVQIATDAAFTVTWTPTDETVVIELFESTGEDISANGVDYLDIGCTFPGSSGTGTVPLDIMARMEGGQSMSLLHVGHLRPVEAVLAGDRTVEPSACWGACRAVSIE